MQEENLELTFKATIAKALRHLSILDSLHEFNSVAKNYAAMIADYSHLEVIFFVNSDSQFYRFDDDSPQKFTLDGITLHAKQSNTTFVVDNCGQDVRYISEIDNPKGHDADSLIFIPMLSSDGIAIGFFVFSRSKVFSLAEFISIKLYVKKISTLVESLLLEIQANEKLAAAISTKADSLYNPEALHFHRQGLMYGQLLEYPKLVPLYFFIFPFILIFLSWFFIAEKKANSTLKAESIILSASHGDGSQKSYHENNFKSFFGQDYKNEHQNSTAVKEGLIVVAYIKPSSRNLIRSGATVNFETIELPKIRCKFVVRKIYDRVASPLDILSYFGEGFFGPTNIKFPVIFIDGIIDKTSASCNNPARLFPGTSAIAFIDLYQEKGKNE